MKISPWIQGVFVAICVIMGSGCATPYADIVRITPRDAWDPRTADQLYRDLTRTIPVPIPPGDFVVNKANDGPSCWISLGDADQTDALVKALRRSDAWTITSIGQINTSVRPMFGLAPEPGSPIPGASRSIYQPTILASR